jgi:hypothetical protein
MKITLLAPDDQHQRPLERIEGSIDQHPADQGNERSPVANHEVRQRTAHRLPEVRLEGGIGCDRGLHHRRRQDPGKQHDPAHATDDPHDGELLRRATRVSLKRKRRC